MNPKSNQTTGVIALQRINEVKLKQARAMRKEMTDAEHILWQYLRLIDLISEDNTNFPTTRSNFPAN